METTIMGYLGFRVSGGYIGAYVGDYYRGYQEGY